MPQGDLNLDNIKGNNKIHKILCFLVSDFLNHTDKYTNFGEPQMYSIGFIISGTCNLIKSNCKINLLTIIITFLDGKTIINILIILTKVVQDNFILYELKNSQIFSDYSYAAKLFLYS